MPDNRMRVNEYFWNYSFRFDLREATRGEQEAVRTCFLAQRLELDGCSDRHVEIVEMVLGKRRIWARKAIKQNA